MAALNDIQLRIIVQGVGLDTLNKLNASLSSAATGVNASAASVKNATTAWGSFRDQLSVLERQFDAVFRAASHLQALGSDLTGMGESIIGMLKESVDQWGEYEFAVHRAAGALSIFDTASPVFHELQGAIDEAAQEVRLFPADEIAKAVYYWGSATGQTVETHEELQTVLDGLIPIMQTAAITETNYETAIKGTYQIIQQYGLGLTRVADRQDVLNGTAEKVGDTISNTADITQKLMMITQNTAVEYSDLIEAFKYTGSIAPALGVAYEDVLLILGRLGDLGIRGSTAGRALQQTFSKLVDPTVRASKALDGAWSAAYGLDVTFKEMVFPNGEFIGLAEYIDQLADVTEDMTQAERNQLIAIMTTQNELRTMIPLVEDQIRARREGISVYDDEKFALENAARQFGQTVHLLEISWKGTLGYLAATVGPVVRAIGAEVARIATPFIEQLGLMLKSIKQWLDTHPEITEWGVRLGALVGVILLVGGALFTTIGILMAFGAGFFFVIKASKIFFTTFSKVIPVLSAISLVVTLLATNFGGLRDAAIKLGKSIVNFIQSMADAGVIDGFNDGIRLMAAILLPAAEVAARAVAGAMEIVAGALDWISQNKGAKDIILGLAYAFGILFALNAANRMVGIGLSILTLGKYSGKGTPLVGKFIDALMNLATNPLRLIKSGAGNVISAIRQIGLAFKAGGFMGAIKAATTAMQLFWISATGPVGITIAAVAALAAAWATDFLGIRTATLGAIDAVTNWLDTIPILKDVRSAVVGLSGAAEDLDLLRSSFTETGTSIQAAMEQVRAAAESAGRNNEEVLAAMADRMRETGEDWKTALDSVVASFNGSMTQVNNAVATNMGGVVSSVKSATTDVTLDVGAMPPEMQSLIDAGLIPVDQASAALMGVMPYQADLATDKVVEIVTELPGDIAAELVGGWDDVNQIMTDYRESIEGNIEDARVRASIEANLASSEIQKGLNSKSTDTRLQTIQLVTDLMNQYETLAPGALAAGELVNPALSGAIEENSLLSINVAKALSEKIGIELDIADLAEVWGKNIPKSMSKGMRDHMYYLTEAANEAAAVVSRTMAVFSPAEAGPLRRIMEWGPNIILSVAEGMLSRLSSLRSASLLAANAISDPIRGAKEEWAISLAEIAKAVPALSSDFSHSEVSERKLSVDITVSSPDGTVNGSTREQLKQIFTAEEFVSALEHMAVVG